LGDGFPKVGRKSWVSVADDFTGETEPTEDIFQIEFRYAGASDCGGAGKEYRAS
jgi:hypothetical protein